MVKKVDNFDFCCDCFDEFIESLKQNKEDILKMFHKRTRKVVIKFTLTPHGVPTWTLETEHVSVKMQTVKETKIEKKVELGNGEKEES